MAEKQQDPSRFEPTEEPQNIIVGDGINRDGAPGELRRRRRAQE